MKRKKLALLTVLVALALLAGATWGWAACVQAACPSAYPHCPGCTNNTCVPDMPFPPYIKGMDGMWWDTIYNYYSCVAGPPEAQCCHSYQALCFGKKYLASQGCGTYVDFVSRYDVQQATLNPC